MPTLRVNPESFAEVTDSRVRSTFLIVCVLDLLEENETIDIRVFENGQSTLDFLNKLDRPNATSAVVGLQLALPPSLGIDRKWQIEPVVDFIRANLERSGTVLDAYAYRTANGRYYTDGHEIELASLKSERSIYQASNANSFDPELHAFQSWIARVLSELVNENTKQVK